MKPSGWLFAACLLMLAALFVVLRMREPASETVDIPAVSTPYRKPTAKSEKQRTERSSISVKTTIRDALSDLALDAEDSRSIFNELKRQIEAAPEQDAAQAIAQFLRSGEDVLTNQSFSVGPGGALDGAPSLRTALMDWLPGLDPRLALDIARETLRSTTSPDEYAMALRNLAWNDLDGDLHAELSSSFRHMVERKEWRRDPSGGFLEAFDIAVQLQDPETFTLLADTIVPEVEHPDIIRAASMSMDRMILRDPSLLSSSWQGDPEWMNQAPMQRASLMSRLDLRLPDHRNVLDSYLHSNRINDEEHEYFTDIFPNGNHLYGHRLVTADEKSPTIEERASMDRVFLERVNEMIEEGSEDAAQHLQPIKDRLVKILGPENP